MVLSGAGSLGGGGGHGGSSVLHSGGSTSEAAGSQPEGGQTSARSGCSPSSKRALLHGAGKRCGLGEGGRGHFPGQVHLPPPYVAGPLQERLPLSPSRGGLYCAGGVGEVTSGCPGGIGPLTPFHPPFNACA